MILSTVTAFLWIWRNPKLWEFLKINLQNFTQKLTTRSSPVVDISRTWVLAFKYRYLLFWCLLLKCKDLLQNFLYLIDTIKTMADILTSKIYYYNNTDNTFYLHTQIYFVMCGHILLWGMLVTGILFVLFSWEEVWKACSFISLLKACMQVPPRFPMFTKCSL